MIYLHIIHLHRIPKDNDTIFQFLMYRKNFEIIYIYLWYLPRNLTKVGITYLKVEIHIHIYILQLVSINYNVRGFMTMDQ